MYTQFSRVTRHFFVLEICQVIVKSINLKNMDLKIDDFTNTILSLNKKNMQTNKRFISELF